MKVRQQLIFGKKLTANKFSIKSKFKYKIAKKQKYKFISLHQTVSTELTLIGNSVEIDKRGNANIENMRQSGSRLVDRPG